MCYDESEDLIQEDKDGVRDYHLFTTIDTPPEQRKILRVGDIWVNAAVCRKCGDQVRSRNRHDMRSCKCGDVAVDGGSWYARRVFASDADYENIIIYYTDIIEETMKEFKEETLNLI